MSRASWLVFAAVVVAAVAAAGTVYQQFRVEHRALWYSAGHDRSAHYLYCLKLAGALRNFDILGFLAECHHACVWPPLHGVLASVILAVRGFDYRLAVLPSLLAWVGTVLLAYLLPRCALPTGGVFAGLIAAALVLASPLHRGFATDVMLESLGACLILAVLYCYLLAVQEQTLSAYRLLAVCLTALVLHKYNYWVLAVVSLTAAEAATRGGFYFRIGLQVVRGIAWPGVLRREVRNPLSWLIVTALLAAAGILLRGPRPLIIGEYAVRIHPPGNVVQAAYVLLLLRIGLLLWSQRSQTATWDGRLRTLLAWHVWPAALFLALPRHLATFLWYCSPANSETKRITFLDGANFYVPAVVEHYHVALWSAVLAVGLFVAALAAWRWLRPGASAILILVLVSAALTAMHPNHQVRYLHPWIAAVWVSAGIGAVALTTFLTRPLGARVSAIVVAATGLALVVAHVPGIVRSGHSAVAGTRTDAPTMLNLTDAVCAEAEHSQRFTVLTTIPLRFLAGWVFAEKKEVSARFEDHWWGFAGQGMTNRNGFQNWLQSTNCDTVVMVDSTAPDRTGVEAEVNAANEVRDLMLTQHAFRLVKQQEFPEHHCRLLVYRR